MLLKDYYSEQFAEMLGDKIKDQYPPFEKEGFISYIAPLIADQEYTGRMKVFVDAFDRYLPAYPETLRIFSEMPGPELSSFSAMYSDGAWPAPVGKYVESHCGDEPECFEQSADFIRELTKRYTGEFAMRPLIRAFPERTMKVLLEWSKSEKARAIVERWQGDAPSQATLNIIRHSTRTIRKKGEAL